MDEQNYYAGDEECPYSWLNEWLCEYVDGTMDPSLQMMFEEYVRANPELEEHIEQLQRTRHMLCRCNDSPTASEDLCARVQGKVEGEMLRTPRSLKGTVKKHPVVTVASSMIVALVIGMFAGITLLEPPPRGSMAGASSPAAVERTQRPPQSRIQVRSTIRSSSAFRAFESTGQQDFLPLIIERDAPFIPTDTVPSSYEVVSRAP